MKHVFWREVAQRKGVLGVQFYSDPWVVHHLDPSEVEEAE